MTIDQLISKTFDGRLVRIKTDADSAYYEVRVLHAHVIASPFNGVLLKISYRQGGRHGSLALNHECDFVIVKERRIHGKDEAQQESESGSAA